ncbi:hypothetical protein [Tepidimicrobium xylanilyticum]|jgi:hypothetical protein|uniref:Uncharacterized protein n=1 Tax=Tepidimicrobium xylanilyticum TaxID=1123352 RepID=A0A1H3F2F0_9FIRM|nr:hypothetical protein [Tepidimicrobium xylanilyticum]MBZ4656493.1 hypothetical protein [Thermoanaerobacter sp.]SDX85161.1 hypothetical protein SAMN05660923_03045 [Tepidimicrobium xylanilyticum]
MKTKPIKLSPKKDGYGNISSYTINIGATEARECGFVDSNGNILPIEKIIDADNNQIIIRLKED